MKQKKVLILGGAGFIGLGIAKYLGANREYEITIADIFSSEQKDSDLNQVVYDYSIKIFEGDFTKKSMFEKLESNYDYLYVLASVVGVNRCIEEGLLSKDATGKLIPEKITSGVPMLGSVVAGFPTTEEQEASEVMTLDEMLITKKDDTFLLRVKGDSMKGEGLRVVTWFL